MGDDLIGRAAVRAALRARLSPPAIRPIVVLLGDPGTGISSLLGAVAAEAGKVRPATVREVPTLHLADLPPDALVIVDDAHRLDAAGRHALEGLAGAGRRVLAGAHLELGPLAGAETVRAGDLDPAAADRLLRRTAGDLGPLDRRLIATRAHGNPLALIELPIAWRATGPASAERVWTPPVTARHAASLIAVPASLPAATRAALDVLAATGSATVASVLAALGGDADPAVLGPAETAGVVVVRGTSAAFRDPLVRAAWWQRLPFAGRAAVHEVLAAVLDGDERWWHAAQAAPGPDDALASRLDSTRPPGDMLTVLRRSALAAELTTDPARRAARRTRAAAAAVQLGHRTLATHLLIDARIENLDAGLAGAEPSADRPIRVPGRPLAAALGEAAFAAGDPRRAAGHLEAAVTSLAALGRFADLAAISAMAAEVAFAAGDWARARWAAGEAVRLATETGRPRWAAFGYAVDAVVAAARGDRRRSSAQIAAALARRPGEAVERRLAVARALGLLAREEPGPAYEIVSGVLAEPMALSLLAEAAVAADRTDQARALLAGQPAAGPESPARVAEFALADALLTGDEPVFRKAFAVLGDWPWLLARARLGFGRHLRLTGRADEARTELHAARSTFAALGAKPWLQRTAAELDGISPPGPASGPDGLTRQELAVARLAAQGLTNREIGERLFLSPRTVSSHLYRIYPKLRVTSRNALRDRLG